MMIGRRPYWVFAAALALGACEAKPGGDSKGKSLDNFAAGRMVRQQDCAGAEESLALTTLRFEGVSRSSALEKAVHSALTAVPESLQELFVRTGGRIVLTRDPGSRCLRAFRNEETVRQVPADQKVAACFDFNKGDDGSQELAIVLKNDVDVIRHGLVREFGYAVAQFLSHLKHQEGGAPFVLNAQPSPQFAIWRKELTQGFLRDLATEGHPQGFAGLISLLGKGADEVVKKNIASGTFEFEGVSFRRPGESRDPAEEQRHYRFRAFEGFVFAEAFDSWYCRGTGKSREVMIRDYPKTAAVFEGLAPKLETAFARMAGESKRGLGLLQDETIEIDLDPTQDGNGDFGIESGPGTDIPPGTDVDVDTSDITDKLNEQQQTIDDLEQQNQDLEQQNQDLTGQNQDLEQQNQDLAGQNQDLEQQNQGLQDQLDQANQGNQGDAPPPPGNGVNGGFTGQQPGFDGGYGGYGDQFGQGGYPGYGYGGGYDYGGYGPGYRGGYGGYGGGYGGW